MMKVDARGWIGIGVFALVLIIFFLLAEYPELRKDEFFKTMSTLIVGTAFVQGVVGWAYTATKQGGELAERAASIAETAASTTSPQPVEVVNTTSTPVPTTDTAAPATAAEELPEYAR